MIVANFVSLHDLPRLPPIIASLPTRSRAAADALSTILIGIAHAFQIQSVSMCDRANVSVEGFFGPYAILGFSTMCFIGG